MKSFALVGLLLLGACSSALDEDLPATALERSAARHLAEGRPTEALSLFRSAATENESSYLAHMGAALCHAHLGEPVAFENSALAAAASAPRTLLAHGQLGSMYVQAAERFRNQPRGRIYAELGVSMLRQVFAARPESAEVVIGLGLGFHLKEDHAMAAFFLERGIQMDPQRLDALQALLLSNRELGRRARVEQLILERAPAGDELPQSWQELLAWARQGQGSAAPEPSSVTPPG